MNNPQAQLGNEERFLEGSAKRKQKAIRKGPTQILADFVDALTFEQLSNEVQEKAKLCILDTVGCALAGSVSKEAETMIKAMSAYDKGSEALIWGTSLRSSLFSSCLINGTMAHVQEMDDVHKKGKVHAGAVVVPATLVLGEKFIFRRQEYYPCNGFGL